MTTRPAERGPDHAEVFAHHERRLLGIAYRMLGSMWDAQDIVADAMVRWLRVDRSAVRDPAAYLTTVVSRLALDELRSLRRLREGYVGPWLPEPLLTDPKHDPFERVERREALHLATLRLLERLTPPERAVYVLREAFDLPFRQIADIIECSEDNARQLLHRARHRMNQEPRFEANEAEHAELLRRFMAAVTGGDFASLTDLLASGVVAYTDGGGKVRAAVRPVVGQADVVRFLAGILDRFPIERYEIVEVNGLPAARLHIASQRPLVALETRSGKVVSIHSVMNPEKLAYMDLQLAAAG